MSKIVEPRTICIDFDQTLCDSVYPDLGPPKAGARKAMKQLKKDGWFIIVSSCRSCSWNWDLYYPGSAHVAAVDRPLFLEMKQWLEDYNIPYDVLDDGTKGKVSAHLYVDDKGFRFDNNWEAVVDFAKRIP